MFQKIKVLYTSGNINLDFLLDVKSDFWIDIKKHVSNRVLFTQISKNYIKLSHLVFRFLEKLSFLKTIPRLKTSKNINFAVVMGPDFGQFLLSRLRGDEIVLYMMDAWPNYHTRIAKGIQLLGIKTIFFSSSQVAEIFKAKGILKHAIWLPEAVRIEKYTAKPMQERNIDVLNFGRKWDLHHNLIYQALQDNNISYLYEKIKGVLIIPDRDAFIAALSDAKITICVSSNITHPERSGEICTITMRYFQCMAAKTILLGRAPQELIDLFGYNPVIEIDMENPFLQIQSILNNPDAYTTLVEKNYETVKSKHTWENRWLQIMSHIDNNVQN
jgi:Glycosyl transferases group 1